jgi:endonuclease-3 related protein
MNKPNQNQVLLEIYDTLFKHFGTQHWWPAESPFEVIIGAILAQSTAWKNVEKGIANLKRAKVLDSAALRNISHKELAALIHSCGYYNAKTIKLKAFANWFGERYGDDLERMYVRDMDSLREELLGVHGVGEETADCILLYAVNKPSFVIDAYTRRIVDRLGIKVRSNKYKDYQKLFMHNLPAEHQLYNEFHALITNLGKNICRKSQPLCGECPLREICKIHTSEYNSIAEKP